MWRRVGGERLRADLFVAGGARRGRRAAVVLVHGGAWVSGDKIEMLFAANRLAGEGFVTVAVNYRIDSDTPYPDEIRDVEAAVRWVRAHAEELGVDSERIALFGSSAGGHLAAFVGTEGSGRNDRGTRVAAVVSWSGIYNLGALVADDTPAVTPNPSAVCGAECPLAWFGRAFMRRSRRGGRLAYAAASPVTAVDRSDPPMLLVSSSDELVPIGQVQEMGRRLTRARVPHTVIVLPGARHSMAYYTDAIGPTIRFLRRRLGWPPRASTRASKRVGSA